jgi:hypothetical protein
MQVEITDLRPMAVVIVGLTHGASRAALGRRLFAAGQWLWR